MLRRWQSEVPAARAMALSSVPLLPTRKSRASFISLTSMVQGKGRCLTIKLMDSKTIRHQNLLRLFARYRTQKDFAEALAVSAQRIGHLINATKAIGDATARQLEQLHGLPPGWMDVPHGAEDAATPYAPLPLSDDQRRLLADYDQMTPAYQTLAREAVAAFLALERSRLAPGVSLHQQKS